MRAVIVDLLANSPFFAAELTQALCDAGIEAELASPLFYLEPQALERVPRPGWIRDLVVHASRPRPLRLAVRMIEAPLNFAGLLGRIRARAYDVVHVQWVPVEGRSPPFMRILRWRCDAAGALLVFTAHNAVPHDSRRVDREAIKRTLDSAHLVVAHSEHVATELRDIGTVTPIVVIPLPTLFTGHPLPPRQEARERLGCPPGPIVLFLGLIRRYKGVDLLVDAWPEVRASLPAASLLVVGKVADPEAARDLERLRDQRNVRVIDRFASVAEMLDLHAVADVVVFPYRRISQSGALMTAAGLGRPTVVTPIPGLQEQAANLRSVIVSDDVSGSSIARAVVASLTMGDEMASAAASDRQAIADSLIGWPSVARAMVDAYASNLRERHHGG